MLIEFVVPWASKTLFLVPHAGLVDALITRGISRGRIWTADEVRQLLAAGMTREGALKVAGTKVQFGAEVTSVQRDASADRTNTPAQREQTQLALPIGVPA